MTDEGKPVLSFQQELRIAALEASARIYAAVAPKLSLLTDQAVINTAESFYRWLGWGEEPEPDGTRVEAD